MEVKKLFKKEFKQALKQIKKFDHIVVFRHQRPDYDAFGTQLGLVTWLKDSFPYKTIHYVGSNHSTFTGRIYPPMEEVDDKFFDEDFLGIVVDTGNSQRIDDERYQKAKFLIKFDHHPNIEPYGNINIVANELSSCSELVASFCLTFKKKYPLSLLSSKYFYTGIVGDTGRFLFPSTDKDTLRLSAELLETGLVPSFGVYDVMYEKDIESLNFQRFVLDNMKVSKKGVAYYILEDKDLKELNIDNERGKEHLSLLSNIRNIPIWFCVTEIKEKNEYRVSIRSQKIDISLVASKYHGGGHINASGATIYSLSEVNNLIEDLEELIK